MRSRRDVPSRTGYSIVRLDGGVVLPVQIQDFEIGQRVFFHVSTICFWGPRAERPWKRPALFLISLLITVFAGFVFVIGGSEQMAAYLLSGFFALLGLAGVAVSVFGCDACVAKAFGEA